MYDSMSRWMLLTMLPRLALRARCTALRVVMSGAPRGAERVSLFICAAAIMISAPGCRGDSLGKGRAPEDGTPPPSVSLDTAAPPDGERTGSAAPDAGDAGADPVLGVPGAVELLERYFAAVNEQRFHDAYIMWSEHGAASGISFEEFARGYDHTRSTRVVIGRPGRIQGAAGSRYIDVPVKIDAITTEGEQQHYQGSIVLRRVVVPGADSTDRSWHLFSAAINEVK